MPDRKARIFVRKDTGERKEFFPDSYAVDNTTQLDSARDIKVVNCYRSRDGDRIDRMPNGTFEDKYRTVWLPEQP